MIEIYIILAFSLLLAAAGVYLSVKNLLTWKVIDVMTMKAKVFLDGSFLRYDFVFTLVIVGLMSIHIILEYMGFKGQLPAGLYIFNIAVIPAVLFVLVLMEYRWYRLLHTKKTTHVKKKI